MFYPVVVPPLCIQLSEGYWLQHLNTLIMRSNGCECFVDAPAVYYTDSDPSSGRKVKSLSDIYAFVTQEVSALICIGGFLIPVKAKNDSDAAVIALWCEKVYQ